MYVNTNGILPESEAPRGVKVSFTAQDIKSVIEEGDRKVVYRNVDIFDYDAYRNKQTELLQQYGVTNHWNLPEGVQPELNDFRYPEPVVTDITANVAESSGEDDDEDYEDHTGYYEFREMLESSGKYGVDIDGIGTAYLVEEYGGEGQGDSYWYVFKVIEERDNVVGAGTPQPRFFKADGYYASYSGGYYDELYEVFPKMVMRTEWGQ